MNSMITLADCSYLFTISNNQTLNLGMHAPMYKQTNYAQLINRLIKREEKNLPISFVDVKGFVNNPNQWF